MPVLEAALELHIEIAPVALLTSFTGAKHSRVVHSAIRLRVELRRKFVESWTCGYLDHRPISFMLINPFSHNLRAFDAQS